MNNNRRIITDESTDSDSGYESSSSNSTSASELDNLIAEMEQMDAENEADAFLAQDPAPPQVCSHTNTR